MDEKWLRTNEIYSDYESRMLAAAAKRPVRRPWEEADREAILADAKKILALRDGMIPEAGEPVETGRAAFDGYDAIAYRTETWKNCYSASTLYLPRGEGPHPLVFVCCGHGAYGRHSESYAAMGHRLAALGMAALVTDNLGQGDRNFRCTERKNEDHWLAVAPFACGLTLQGMIVAETLGVIRRFAKDPRFDPARLGACGNSGGGTLTLFLAALAPELSAIASSGYPSEFGAILAKERRHCSCNLLRGVLNKADMWEIYSLFAPKPLLLEGGRWDDLFPQEAVLRCHRKVKNTYVQFGADAAFESALTPTRHSWEAEDIALISSFLSRRLLGVAPEDPASLVTDDPESLRVAMPGNALSTAALAETLSGRKAPEGIELWDLYPPVFRGERARPESFARDLGRGDVMRVFAQYEFSLISEEKE